MGIEIVANPQKILEELKDLMREIRSCPQNLTSYRKLLGLVTDTIDMGRPGKYLIGWENGADRYAITNQPILLGLLSSTYIRPETLGEVPFGVGLISERIKGNLMGCSRFFPVNRSWELSVQ